MALTVEQASYLAGAIDGEGSIQVGAHQRTPTSTPAHRARVTVCNTNEAWLKTLQSWAGGRVVKVGTAYSRATRRQCYRLEWDGPSVRAVLPQVLPYLLIKRPQALLVLEYFTLAAERRASNLPGKRCDPGVVARIEAIRAQIKGMNLRGTVPPRPRPIPIERLCAITSCNRPKYSNGYCKQHHKKYVERGGPAWYERICVVCEKPFIAKRKDAVACSKRCSCLRYYEANKAQIIEQVRQRRIASRSSSSATSEAVVPSQAVEDGCVLR